MVADNLNDQVLLDTTIYLASLASERRVIDPLLDTVRGITARLVPHQPLSSRDREALVGVQDAIKTYLITKDPVRAFTQESLEAKLRERQGEKLPLLRQRPGLALAGVWALALALFGLTFAVPLPLPLAARAQLAVPMMYVGLHAGMAWFYLSALRRFKPELRRAYRYIVVATLITGLGVIHFPIAQVFELGKKWPLFSQGGLMEIFGLASVFFYLGTRILANTLGLKSRWTNMRLATGLGTVLVVAGILTGYVSQRAHMVSFDLTFIGVLFIIAYCGLAAVLARQVSRRVTPQYAAGLAWLSACLAGVGLGTFIYLFVVLSSRDLSAGPPLYILPIFVVTELLMLQAGYVFRTRVEA